MSNADLEQIDIEYRTALNKLDKIDIVGALTKNIQLYRGLWNLYMGSLKEYKERIQKIDLDKEEHEQWLCELTERSEELRRLAFQGRILFNCMRDNFLREVDLDETEKELFSTVEVHEIQDERRKYVQLNNPEEKQ